jgi:hypothetical protein
MKRSTKKKLNRSSKKRSSVSKKQKCTAVLKTNSRKSCKCIAKYPLAMPKYCGKHKKNSQKGG